MGFALGLGSNLESSLGTLGSVCVVLKEIPNTQVEVFELVITSFSEFNYIIKVSFHFRSGF